MVVDRPKLFICWGRPYGLWNLRKERHELGGGDRQAMNKRTDLT